MVGPRLGRLLCAGEVAAALGEPARPPACVPLGRSAEICRWRSAADRRGSLTLTAIGGQLALHTMGVERRLGRAVPCAGEEAYLRAGPVCVVRCGECVLKLVLSGSRAPDPAAAVVLLARLAAGRLRPPGGPGPGPAGAH